MGLPKTLVLERFVSVNESGLYLKSLSARPGQIVGLWPVLLFGSVLFALL